MLCIQTSAGRNRFDWLVQCTKETLAIRTSGIAVDQLAGSSDQNYGVAAWRHSLGYQTRYNVVRVTKNAKLQTICCSANLHSGYAVSLGVTQLALQRHEVPETHKNYRHTYGAYRQHDDHAWSAFTGSGFFCGFNDAALGCLLWHQALLDFSGDKSST
jgi:hypothetical protein